MRSGRLRRAGTQTRAIADREGCAAPHLRRSLYRFVGNIVEEDVFFDLMGIALDSIALNFVHGAHPSCVEIVQ
jgi:hypothetical protein